MAPGHREPPGHCAVWIGHQGTPACVTVGLFREEMGSAVMKEPVLSLGL